MLICRASVCGRGISAVDGIRHVDARRLRELHTSRRSIPRYSPFSASLDLKRAGFGAQARRFLRCRRSEGCCEQTHQQFSGRMRQGARRAANKAPVRNPADQEFRTDALRLTQIARRVGQRDRARASRDCARAGSFTAGGVAEKVGAGLTFAATHRWGGCRVGQPATAELAGFGSAGSARHRKGCTLPMDGNWIGSQRWSRLVRLPLTTFPSLLGRARGRLERRSVDRKL